MVRDELIKNINNDRSLHPEERQTAVKIAQSYPAHGSGYDLNTQSWGVVRNMNGAADRYVLAMRQAENACRDAPSHGFFLNTLGVAQYRCGLYREALETLAKSDNLNVKAAEHFKHGKSFPKNLAFLAMTHHQLGNKEEAQKLLKQLRESMGESPSDDAKAFLKEAEELIDGK